MLSESLSKAVCSSDFFFGVNCSLTVGVILISSILFAGCLVLSVSYVGTGFETVGLNSKAGAVILKAGADTLKF